jgi:septal ring factor EnvC (AmiA/AmiB activator)
VRSTARLPATFTLTHEASMTTPLKPILTVASLLLAFAASLAFAQTAPKKPPATPAAKATGKTLGGNAATGGKLMTREELRGCLKRLDDVNQAGKDIEAQRPQFDRERDELKASGDVLKAEQARLQAELAAIREWEGRIRALGAEVESFNKRSAALQEAPRNQQDKLAEELKADRERLETQRLALRAEETKLVPAYQAGTKDYNEQVGVRDARVTDWNARNAASVDAAGKQQEARALWLNECANRPYMEDDEKAIKAGK